MKYLLLFFLIALISVDINSQSKTQTIQESIAISNLSVRSLSSDVYVRELRANDFSNSLELNSFAFLEEVFTDDGLNNDEVANDGVFTSLKTYKHNSDIVYDKTLSSKVISNYIFTTATFKYDNDLSDLKFKSNGEGDGDKGGPTIGIKVDADICFCGCESCSCLACKWWEGPGCWYFCDGSIHIEIGLGW